jgi:carbon storage regulator
MRSLKTLKGSVPRADYTKEVENCMLILTRKAGESILIGDDIEVTITSIDQNKVRVGIRSPAHIPIYREELYQKIQKENRAAAFIGKEEFESLLDMYAGSEQGGPPDRG